MVSERSRQYSLLVNPTVEHNRRRRHRCLPIHIGHLVVLQDAALLELNAVVERRLDHVPLRLLHAHKCALPQGTELLEALPRAHAALRRRIDKAHAALSKKIFLDAPTPREICLLLNICVKLTLYDASSWPTIRLCSSLSCVC